MHHPRHPYTGTTKTIWALTDGRPGNDNQVIAVAQRLGEYENRRIEFSQSATLPNFLLGTSDLGILTSIDTQSFCPDIVIGAGRKLARVSRIIKKGNPNVKIIQLMWPGYGHKDFDLIFAPEHDNLKPQSNLITTFGPPNLMTPDLLQASAEKWKNRIPIDSKPAIAVLVGNITREEGRKLVNLLNSLSGYFMITTSRRSNKEVVADLKNNISSERYFYEWSPTSENPYLGMVALADFTIVTEDSISMMSECVTSGKPTYIFPVEISKKHKSFSQSLVNSGRAKYFLNNNLQSYEYEKLNTLDYIIRKIQEII